MARPWAAVFIPLPHSHFGITCSLQLNKAFAGNAIKLQPAVPAPWFYTEKALVSGGLVHPTDYKLDFLPLQAVLPGWDSS